MTFENEELFSDEVESLLELASLERRHLYQIICELYDDIYGHQPLHMKSWDNFQLIGWFRANYLFDEDTQRWVCVHEGMTIH